MHNSSQNSNFYLVNLDILISVLRRQDVTDHATFNHCALFWFFLRTQFDKKYSTSVAWEKQKSDEDKFFLRVAQTNIETKYYSVSAENLELQGQTFYQKSADFVPFRSAEFLQVWQP